MRGCGGFDHGNNHSEYFGQVKNKDSKPHQIADCNPLGKLDKIGGSEIKHAGTRTTTRLERNQLLAKNEQTSERYPV